VATKLRTTDFLNNKGKIMADDPVQRTSPMTYEEVLQIIDENAKTKATELELSEEFMKKVPPEIGQLTHLTSLILSYNLLPELPDEIGQLTNLIHLHIGGNKLKTLPKTIGQLTQLKILVLGDVFGGNPITSSTISSLSVIDNLTNLVELHLSSTHLTTLPFAVERLTQLKILDLRWNFLTALPKELGLLPNLEHVYVHANHSLTFPPREIMNKETKEMLAYLREQL
jgi:Leucine-rich repeat (LRR) protein